MSLLILFRYGNLSKRAYLSLECSYWWLIKYLGVIIDNKLTWIPHITHVKNKVSKGIGIMFKAKKILKKNTLINLYHSYIYPYLIYCIEAWGNASNCHLEQLY